MIQYRLYIDGTWQDASTEAYFDVTNPADGSVVGRMADGGKEEVKKAVDAASRAFPAWSRKTARERGELLARVYDGMMERKEEMARLMTQEQGKPLAEARGEVQYAADFFQWYAEEAKRIYGETIPASSPDKRIWVQHQPVGVAAAITPWNFPAAMITRKAAPALAAGCTMVVKPAEQTPLTAALLAEIMENAGIPAGVFNLVTGSRAAEIGDALLADERVRKLTFTGSTEVGKTLMRQAADTVKRLSLELGGHAPYLVFEDADLEQAAQEVLDSKFRNAGQTCVCTNRVYVHRSIKDEFTSLLTRYARELKVGNGLEEDVQIGPLIDEAALEKVDRHVRDAEAKGAKVMLGGNRIPVNGNGCFFEPTVLLDTTEQMQVEQEETFGPVLPVHAFDTEEEALELANNTRFGLAAYLYTRDLSRAVRVSEGLEYGIVGVNDGMPSTAQAPFGGMKESGLGREGGRYGIEEYLETKYISIGLK
ncbi:MAG: NAD-dependent succinate-semialdehyde dehydrogenase [Firmicutes bacterium]|uniref:Succinate semialdehyde dehydrogenase n=1 Tax=Melghirimyces thermohalophilus TaxID=1236220 RepID=A0A1G6NPQ8_9BACL|nr:NAD-dependent succinate-semialdehyde dehydrogenase [Melghirimyces thermohalophilus]MDA8353893.1 NAD-dependent succinate-semialdehyde dehydrogenase [Bacillota bacterium]SDC69145.1 succinate semialdehyde dehydrogenase [Melghirimyces thermohalophilus]